MIICIKYDLLALQTVQMEDEMCVIYTKQLIYVFVNQTQTNKLR